MVHHLPQLAHRNECEHTGDSRRCSVGLKNILLCYLKTVCLYMKPDAAVHGGEKKANLMNTGGYTYRCYQTKASPQVHWVLSCVST